MTFSFHRRCNNINPPRAD